VNASDWDGVHSGCQGPAAFWADRCVRDYVVCMSNRDVDANIRQLAGWLPNQDELDVWLAEHRERVKARGEQVVLHPVILELQHLIDTDPVVRLYLNQMVEQVPKSQKYDTPPVESVDELLRMMNEVLTMAPEFSVTSMVTTPLGAILDWSLGTASGFAAYRDPRMNAWCVFLDSEESLYVLNESPSGWKSAEAQKVLGIEQFDYEPDDQYWGFSSWNDFFTRRFREEARPVASPNNDKIIASACESTPYRISTDVARRSRFWIKSQPYSLEDMLANDESVDEFVGGTVYQAYLSATEYHRWHSPVAGSIVRAFVQKGTYYSEADAEGPAALEPTNSQGYMAHVATRGIILIDADNPAIGLVAFVPIGMSDVSSIMINSQIKPGYHVEKGEELGYFQFGGSTECLVFRPEVIAEFSLEAIPQPDNPDAPPVQVRSRLATARSRRSPGPARGA
jgi:phosphatidylserine decarboxylase